MLSDDGRQVGQQLFAHRVTWFPPDRPVDGNTIYLRPDARPAPAPAEGVVQRIPGRD